jgi:hypothetical protein
MTDSFTVFDADAPQRRHCGDCTLCCRLLPVAEIEKPALAKCRHQCRRGCRVYDARPVSCRAWSCQWLQGHPTGPRPDRAHLCIDPMPDYVTGRDKATGALQTLGVWQVWCDPSHRDAHRASAFRAWLQEQGRLHRMCALVRYGSAEGLFLAPPSVTGAGWVEIKADDMTSHEQHTATEVAAALSGQIKIEIAREA